MNLSDLTLMIVDDEIYYRNSIKVAIEFTLHCKTIEMDNGDEAYNYLKYNDKPDLILLDIHMPMMDGISFLEKIKKDAFLKQISIIPYTQDTSEETVNRLLELGINDFIVKGIDIDKMLSKIKKALLKIKYGDKFDV